MRRLFPVFIVVLVVAGPRTPLARAHSCSTPAEIPVGESTTIVVGVPAELQPVVGVDIDVPDGFRLDKAGDVGPWKVERVGSQLRYRGGVLDAYACASFNLQGAAERQMLLAFRMTVHGQDGSQVEYTSTDSGDVHSAQLVYAGFSPPEAAAIEDGGSSWLSGSTVGLAVAAAAIGGAFLLARRQQRRARPARPRAGSRTPTAKRKR